MPTFAFTLAENPVPPDPTLNKPPTVEIPGIGAAVSPVITIDFATILVALKRPT